MSNCCGGNGLESTASRCPQSGSAGSAVDLRTVKALLTAAALGRLEPSDYRFCGDARCDVVYFNAAGSCFSTGDLRVPVWQKLPAGDRLLCYCFGESEATIRAEIEMTGRSTAADRIRHHIGAGRCTCETRNPKGRCCLGDVIAALKRAEPAAIPRTAPVIMTEAADVS